MQQPLYQTHRCMPLCHNAHCGNIEHKQQNEPALFKSPVPLDIHFFKHFIFRQNNTPLSFFVNNFSQNTYFVCPSPDELFIFVRKSSPKPFRTEFCTLFPFNISARFHYTPRKHLVSTKNTFFLHLLKVKLNMLNV